MLQIVWSKEFVTVNTTLIPLVVSISCRLNVKNQSDQVSIVTPFLANLDAGTFYHVIRHLSKYVELGN